MGGTVFFSSDSASRGYRRHCQSWIFAHFSNLLRSSPSSRQWLCKDLIAVITSPSSRTQTLLGRRALTIIGMHEADAKWSFYEVLKYAH